ncbi:MAG: aldo/keto reductase [Gammaproteobacteria bacterium]|nr:aldo/keto reductase [Gammaproteobacteria bacterium]
MKKSFLGYKSLPLSYLGLGCMGMSECYGTPNDMESIKTIHRAIESGITHIDTADCYGLGHNEYLLAEALKGLREKVVLASKCGMIRNPETGQFTGVNGRPEYIKQSCEASLKRLQVDYLDLFYLHRADPDTPIEDSMGAFSDLVTEGKIRHIGLSEVAPQTIVRAHKVHPLTAIQSEYSLWHRKAEEEVIPLCQSLNIGFVAHGPLGKGFLTGTIQNVNALEANDLRRILPRFQDENISHNLAIVTVLRDIADKRDVTPAQIALAWVLAQGNNIVAIMGTKQRSHLEENLKAAYLTLSTEELLQIEQSIPLNFAKGDLLPESFAQFSDH